MADTLTSGESAAIRLDVLDAGLEDIEVRLLLEGIRLCYGYDFREYALGPLRRSIRDAMTAEGVSTISAYQDRVLHDAAWMHRFLGTVGVNVTSMFREVELMRCLREEVVPVLRTYPSVRIWIAGCATGEEVYSLAILLQEEGVLRRASIFATDLNEDTLAVARTGAYPLDRVLSYEERYEQSGGRGNLFDHYSVFGRSARFHRNLQNNVTWARHNLVTDASFNEFHMIICANVFSPESSRYQQVRHGVSLFRTIRC